MDTSGFYPGDRPAETLPVVPFLELSDYPGPATGKARRPDGSAGGDFAVTVNTTEEQLDLDLSTLEFDVPGVWLLEVTVTTGSGEGARKRRVAPVPIVVQDEASGWHTLDSARATGWADAVSMADVGLHQLLESARRDVEAYAPALVDGAPIPQAYRDAQLMQARNRHNAENVDPASGEGFDNFAIAPRPLDWQVKQLLRPRRGKPATA